MFDCISTTVFIKKKFSSLTKNSLSLNQLHMEGEPKKKKYSIRENYRSKLKTLNEQIYIYIKGIIIGATSNTKFSLLQTIVPLFENKFQILKMRLESSGRSDFCQITLLIFCIVGMNFLP